MSVLNMGELVKAYVVKCGGCGSPRTVLRAKRKADAERVLRGMGWSKTARSGWFCASCKK